YENQASVYANQIANIDRQAANIAAQRADLQRKLALVQANLGRQLTTAEKELADVQKRIRKGDAEEGRLRRATGGAAENSQSLARAAVAAALSTYEPFPLDEERDRLTSK
ncbi:MAG TPA: hypothetical protein PLV92_22470, partial [Pirellulaceae bacterium]|nr:hypothetical protein [Pirellulaceae bacterium]